MSEICKFWLNWSVELATAVGTIAAVIVALYGDKIKSKLFPPNINMQLLSPTGELCAFNDGSNSRWFHLKIENKKAWPVVRKVQIYLARLWEIGPDDRFQVAWVGEVPLRWRHQEVHTLQRDFGSPYSCDFFYLSPKLGLRIATLLEPNNLPAHGWKHGVKLLVDVEAHSEDGVLAQQRYEIAWNGQWKEADSEIAKCLKVNLMQT